MTYAEAVKEAMKIPLTEPRTIREFILKVKDQEIVSQLCAKWFSIVSRELNYRPEPKAPEAYGQMMRALKERNEVWRAYMKEPEMVLYVETKRDINVRNHANYQNIKHAIDNLHPSEVGARKELLARLTSYINGTTAEPEPPFMAWRFFNHGDLERYGIKPERQMQDDTRPVQGRDY